MTENAEQETKGTEATAAEAPLRRHGKVSYLDIPAVDAKRSAAFYEKVFGWSLRGDTDQPHFDDAAGDLIGSWVTGRAISSEPGLLPYIYVDGIDDTLEKIGAHGGQVVRAPFPEGDLWVATFRDPAGNVIGVWQKGPR